MRPYFIKSKLLLGIIFLLLFEVVAAQEHAYYINYGRQSLLSSGDENYKQAFFIKIPESAPDKFYIRIFDAECSGMNDDLLTVYNTETKFSLYGTYNILPDEAMLYQSAEKIENESGELIYQELYGADFELDNKWTTFAEVNKRLGEYDNGFYYFKLLAEGGYGTDGNVYDLFISSIQEENSHVNGAELFSYMPTLRNGKSNKFAQIKFFAQSAGTYLIYNFDMDGASFNYDTPFRSGIKLNASSNGKSALAEADIDKYEKGNFIALNFSRFRNVNNDVAVSIKDPENKSIPIPLPVYYKKANRRPVIVKQISSTELWNKKVFDASSTSDADGNSIRFKWFFGDGKSAEGIKVSHVYEKSGTYNGLLIAVDNSGSIENSAMQNFVVKVNQSPLADAGSNLFASSSEVYFDASASYDPDGEIIKYEWDFGDGSTSSGVKTKHVYANQGDYFAILKVTDDSRIQNNYDYDTLRVTVNKKPIADAGPDIITEPGKELLFNADGSIDPDGEILSYLWDFGDGSFSDEISTYHIYNKPGNYTVILEVKDDTSDYAAADYDEATVTVNAAPFAFAGKDILAAPDEQIIFDASNSTDFDSEKLNYHWEFSDGKSNSDDQIVERSFQNPGIYQAYLTVTDNSGALNNKSSDQISIRINNSPVAVLKDDIYTCTPTILLNASSSYDPDGDKLKFTWNFGDGSPEVHGVNVTHAYKSKGSYPVILTVDDGTGVSNARNSVSITVIINQVPVADAGEDITICMGEFVPLDGGNSYDPENGLMKYYWDFGDGTFAEGINPVKSFYKSGIYQVKLMVEDDSGLECNKDSDTKIITVIESPVAEAGDDLRVCAFQEVEFDGTKSTDADGVVNSYTWDFGDGSTGGGARPKHTYTKAGVYKVALSITGESQSDCDNSSADEITVIVDEAPEADFDLLTTAPIETEVEFDASPSNGKSDDIINYKWDFGDGQSGSGKIVNHEYLNSGLFFVKLTITASSNSSCSSSSVVKSILINEAPVATAEAPSRTKVNTAVNFSAHNSFDKDGAITEYQWDFGDGNSAEGIFAEHIYHKTGTYNVKLRVKDNTNLFNNSAYDELQVEVYEEPELSISAESESCPDKEFVFTALLSPDLADSSINFEWDFGDGLKSQGRKTEHKFTNAGIYNVVLTAENESSDNGSNKVVSKEIKINNSPVIIIPDKIYACPGEEVLLDASDSYDTDGKLSELIWQVEGNILKGEKIRYTFKSGGEKTIKISAKDDSNTECGKSEKEITVIVNSPPSVNTDKTVKGFTGGAYDAVLFDASNSIDNDGDALTYSWDFGDGSKGSGSKTFHYYNKPGWYKAVLHISDGRNSKCSSVSEVISVEIKER